MNKGKNVVDKILGWIFLFSIAGILFSILLYIWIDAPEPAWIGKVLGTCFLFAIVILAFVWIDEDIKRKENIKRNGNRS